MSSKPIIVVIGATGIQGGSVVKTFLKEPEWQIRGLTRNTSSKASQELSAKGVEMVAANLDEVDSLVSAFQGATAIFSVTDFWNPFYNPENRQKVKPGQTINEWVYEYELQQGKNVFDAAAKTTGLQRLIYSSLSDVTKWSHGKYTNAFHFDSKAHADKYGREKYPELWAKTSIIQVGMYLSNYLSLNLMTPKKEANGTFSFSNSISGNVKLPFVATEEDTGPLVKALLAVSPGKNLIAYREWLTQDEFMPIWSKGVGVKGELKTLTYEETENAMGPELGKEVAEMSRYFVEHGYEARDDPSVVHPKDLGVPVNLGTVEEWVKKQDWSKVINQ